VHASRFFDGFTPITVSPDIVRAARIYPGGSNLDQLVGRKERREDGWFYPEAWIFSPVAAINPGSTRDDEGATPMYDRDGRSYSWREYSHLRRDEVLGKGSLDISVKLLDSDCTLPKEFHFRGEDEELLRRYPRLREFDGTLTKPEIWIRHPTVCDDTSPSYLGFRDELDSQRLEAAVEIGGDALEELMHEVDIPPGEGLFIPGGVVHSLGRGVYFEVLADGDLKVTLDTRCGGRELSIEERLGPLALGEDDSMQEALAWLDHGPHDDRFVERSRCRSAVASGATTTICDSVHFSARWASVAPGSERTLRGGRAHVLVVANGVGELAAGETSVGLRTRATSFDEFASSGVCYAGIVHASTSEYVVRNTSDDELILLLAYEGALS
jgi:hypothetical protein